MAAEHKATIGTVTGVGTWSAGRAGRSRAVRAPRPGAEPWVRGVCDTATAGKHLASTKNAKSTNTNTSTYSSPDRTLRKWENAAGGNRVPDVL